MNFKLDNISIKHLLNNINRTNYVNTTDFNFDKLFDRPLDLLDYENKTGYFQKIFLEEHMEFLGYRCKNLIFYPPHGGMGWHTNGPKSGKRIYISWSESGDSGMNWYDVEKDNIIIDKDETGFNIRIFDIPQWHCVWSKCNRFSIGFDIG
jgi:hypothetical protein